jgi:hypothetical protein
MRPAAATGSGRAMSPALLALARPRAGVGCAPEITLCQVDGMKFETADGTLMVWVNPILYVRVYRDGLFESTNIDHDGAQRRRGGRPP